MKSKHTKKALLMSVLSMLVCMAMLAGSTFAWFTDSVTSGKNKIVAGNLDVELYAKNGDTYEAVTADTNLFMKDALWEPGHVEVVNLKVANVGTLALQYKFGINVAAEKPGTNKAGETFNLSDHIMFALLEGEQSYESREDAIAAAQANAVALSDLAVDESGVLYPAAKATAENPDSRLVTLVVYMPTTVGDEANYQTGTDAPEIDLGVSLVAAQTPYESDSFGEDYDEDAKKDMMTGVSIQGIAGYEDVLFPSVQEAYAAISPVVERLGGLEQNPPVGANLEEQNANFDAVYNQEGNITWTIYGEQTVDNPYLFSFGRKASYYNNQRSIKSINIVGGNSTAKLIMNTEVALPYNWWSEEVPTVSANISNLTLEKGTASRISFEPQWGYGFDLSYRNCNINGSIHYLYNNACTLTFDGCHFKNVEGNTYAYAVFVQGSETEASAVTFANNTFEGYDRGINMQRAATDFKVLNNIFKDSKKDNRGVVQITGGKSFTVSGNTFDSGVVGYAVFLHELLTNADVVISGNTVNSAKYRFDECQLDSANVTVTEENNVGTAME
ncbi:MAG: SipW-dependent-type signal peptide-containing protein [Clostridiales bacterium]|nr:SipW-dependent-type signal peptide-containing protein [Clostridiales bacterium]